MQLSDSLAIATGTLGIFIAIPLVYLSNRRFANLYLGVFLILFALLCFASTSAYYSTRELFGLLDWSISLLGPSFYLYTRDICGARFSPVQLLHLLPLVLFIAMLPLLRQSDAQHTFTLFLIIFQCITAAYAVATLIQLRSFRFDLLNNFSSTKQRDLHWLGLLAVTMIILLIIWFPASLFGGAWGWAFSINRILILFFIGWYGLRQQTVFSQDSILVRAGKYERSGMNEHVKSQITKNLRRSMLEDKDYLINDLKLTELAKKIGTSSQLMSEYFNKVEGKSFFQYVNELRVKEAMRLIREQKNRAITDISYQAGFNSKSTFNTSFKNIVGLSPTQWRKKQCNCP